MVTSTKNIIEQVNAAFAENTPKASWPSVPTMSSGRWSATRRPKERTRFVSG